MKHRSCFNDPAAPDGRVIETPAYDLAQREIGIRTICDRADVARSTFYAHYQTKQDLLDAGFASGTQDTAREVLDGPVEAGRIATVHWLVGHMTGSKSFLRRLQSTPAGLAINARFKDIVRQLLARELDRAGHALDDAQIAFLTGGIFAVTERWIVTRSRARPEALIERLHALAAAVIAPAPVPRRRAPA